MTEMTQENKPKFVSCQNKGFQMTFYNGMTISVQWGVGNYCSRRSLNSTILSEMKEPTISSEDAEIAIWDADDNWFDFGSDQVKGFCSTDEVAKIMTFVQGAKSFKDLEEILNEFGLL